MKHTPIIDKGSYEYYPTGKGNGYSISAGKDKYFLNVFYGQNISYFHIRNEEDRFSSKAKMFNKIMLGQTEEEATNAFYYFYKLACELKNFQ